MGNESGQGGFNWGAVGGAAMGIGGNLLQGIGRKRREERGLSYQKDLMGLQQRNQMDLNKQGHQLQMDMWNKTNYGAQMEHLKDAGLNPALMYGMSGGGGTTAGSQSGGGAGGGNAPEVKETQVGNGGMMGMQMASQIALTNAQTQKVKTETENLGEGGIIRGKTLQEIENLIAVEGTEKEKMLLVKAQGIAEKLKGENYQKDTKLKGKQIEVAEQERMLKKYEVDLNKLGIQKTDNKIFRFLTKMAGDNGVTLQEIIEQMTKGGGNPKEFPIVK
jgi:hypothetical protein